MAIHITVLEVRLLDEGGLYARLAFRDSADDPEPFWVNDFRWNRYIPWLDRRPLLKDEAGRVRIRNKWEWERELDNDGILVPNPRLADAEMIPFDAEACLDELLGLVLEKAEAVRAAIDAGFEGPPDTAMPPERRPNENASPTAQQAAVKSRFPTFIVDDLGSVNLRRSLRRR